MFYLIKFTDFCKKKSAEFKQVGTDASKDCLTSLFMKFPKVNWFIVRGDGIMIGYEKGRGSLTLSNT